jgi:hypothetical protein
MMAEEVVNKDTTETRVLITEDKHGNLNVQYEMIIKGTEVAVPFRYSHLIGQLFVATIIIVTRGYKKIFANVDQSNSISKDKIKPL